MPLSNLLKSAAGTCPFCNRKAGIIARAHRDCQETFQAGWTEMAAITAEAARTHSFDEKNLRLTLTDISHQSYGDDATVNQALEEGWKQGVAHSMADGIMSQIEETKLREFRDRLALVDTGANPKATAELAKASRDRLMLDARLAALAVEDADTHLNELAEALRQSTLYSDERTNLLVRAWEAAVEGTLEDGLLSFDEENALARYLNHFGIDQRHANRNGAQTSMVKAAVIRELTEGVVPQRQNTAGRLPFNLMKSETLVWTMGGVDYLEVVAHRERRGSSQGLNVRVARRLYYRPSTFRSRSVESEETVHQDTGLLGFTTKHLYFSGPKKKFRVRYDKIVSFELYSDGLDIMRDTQTAKPQSFVTGDGWFAYNLAVNLAQFQR